MHKRVSVCVINVNSVENVCVHACMYDCINQAISQSCVTEINVLEKKKVKRKKKKMEVKPNRYSNRLT